MLEVRRTTEDGRQVLTLTGHAGTRAPGAEEGQGSIVCAAASMLWYTLVEGLRATARECEAAEEPGKARIVWRQTAKAQAVEEAILRGFSMLERDYEGAVVLHSHSKK